MSTVAAGQYTPQSWPRRLYRLPWSWRSRCRWGWGCWPWSWSWGPHVDPAAWRCADRDRTCPAGQHSSTPEYVSVFQRLSQKSSRISNHFWMYLIQLTKLEHLICGISLDKVLKILLGVEIHWFGRSNRFSSQTILCFCLNNSNHRVFNR